MSTALAVSQETEKNIYESLALKGDISGLNPQDKTIYLQKLCESLKLNHLTQPFIPLKLNGKEVLYASRGATDQLASVHKITREIIKAERLEDVYIVTCKATAPDGRFDISTGVVTIGNLKGDNLANALMKAETKAKRRVTLSICGLGFLDESELETIPQNRMQQLPEINPIQEDPINKQLSEICNKLNRSGDAIEWNKKALNEYASTLFDLDPVTENAFNLLEDLKKTLAEDLEIRLNERLSLQNDPFAE